MIMNTLTVEIADEAMNGFMGFVSQSANKIHIQEDENLKKDPLFYQRKAEIQQIMDDIDSGKSELLTQAEYRASVKNFFDELDKKDGD